MNDTNRSIADWDRLRSEFERIPDEYDEDHPAWQEAEGASVDIVGAYAQDGREDLTELETFTIDPADARDFDDALSLEDDGDGYTLYVHIADVSEYIESGSELDQAAKERGNTFYLDPEKGPDGEPEYHTIHMLPETLSTDVCSLRPEEDRLAHTFELDLDGQFNVQDYDQYKSIVHSDRRFTYDEADDAIEDGGDHAATLHALDTITQQWRDDRYDSSLILNPDDSRSSRIIQEAMVTTNHETGRYLQQEGLTGIYRIEEPPQSGWREDITKGLQDLGHRVEDGWLHDQPKKSLNDFIADLDGDFIQDEKKEIITKMARARFDEASADHFALGIRDYAQVTSPIRRAGDLINHQILSAHLDMEDQYDELLDIVDPEDLDADELSYHEGVLALQGARQTDEAGWDGLAARFRRELGQTAYQITQQQEEAQDAERAWAPASP